MSGKKTQVITESFQKSNIKNQQSAVQKPKTPPPSQGAKEKEK